LRKLAFKIINSSTLLLPRWKLLLNQLQLTERLMPRDVRTRWNSTYDMLNFAIEYKAGLIAMSGDADNGLRQYEMSKKEWEIAEQLRDIFKDATLFFCRGTPSLATVIPAMDHINKILASQCANKKFVRPIRVALAMGKKTLDRYYNLTDASDVYRIAMGM
ncbi:hypothetical protein BJ138DRAFT_1018302, partial [Hygrophoropsis aurantiaca]